MTKEKIVGLLLVILLALGSWAGASLISLTSRTTIIEVEYKNIKDDVTEIKGDVKTILGKMP